MTVELLPQGIKCNLSCSYCYQEPMRVAGNFATEFNFDKVKQALIKQNAPFAVFGGEPLLTPKSLLEEIFKFGFERFHGSSIQTNGLLIDDDHIDMFHRYKVSVGISIDGFHPENSARSSREETGTILWNLKQLISAKITPSIIVTIHRLNAINRTLDFLQWLDGLGITHINLHILEVDTDKSKSLKLTNLQNTDIFIKIYEWSKSVTLKINPFEDIKQLLTREQTNVNCTWNACDAISTNAVQGIRGDGTLSNCGRTNKDGVDWIKSESQGKERYIALFNTPLHLGGCQSCQYFYACKGQCPGTAIDGDWRNKTEHCQFWFNLIDFIRRDLSLESHVFSYDRMIEMGEEFIANLTSNPNEHLDVPHGDYHGDHTDVDLNHEPKRGSSGGVAVSWKD